MVVRTLLVRGIYAGVAAGLLSWLFSYVVGEPGIEGGLAFEEQLAHAGGESDGAELVSRGLQATVGLGAALVVFAVAIGGLFALAYAVAYGRIGALSPRATAAVLAAGAFLVVFLVPFLKYPANPPATSDDVTIAQRTGIYLGLVLISVILAVASVVLGRRLNARLGAWNSALVAIGVYVVTVGLVMFVLPTVNETPADFPATVLYQFRLASVGNQLVLWSTIGLLFGWLTDRSLRRLQASPRVDRAAANGQGLRPPE